MKLALVALALMLAAPSWAATYWVRPTGSNLKQGAFDGSDSTAARALSLAWFNANAVAGDACRFAFGNYATPINPANDGTNAARITYFGSLTAPGSIVIPAITIDSTASGAGDYISVRGLTVAGQAATTGGFHHARWDSITYCTVRGGLSLAGGYNFVQNCSIGDGTPGDAFDLAWNDALVTTTPNAIPGQDGVWPNFANNRSNRITDCTFNLAKAGGGTPVVVWRAQDSLYVARCRFKVRIGAGSPSMHLWTIYGMTNSVIEDCHFNGQTQTPQAAHFPSTRDVFHHNSFVRDTILEEPGGASSTNLALMTSGATGITGEYNGNNTYRGMFVRVRGYVGYQETCNNETHERGIYIVNGEDGANALGKADSLTFYHNTWINLGNAIVGEDGAVQYAKKIRGNLFYGGARKTCNGQIAYGTTTPGAAGALDSNLVWVRGYPADSAEAIDVGGCASYRPAAASAWCVTYNQDCASRWLDPLLSDTLSWQTINPVPPSTSIAYSTLWADGYVGAVPAFADVVRPVIDLQGPVPYVDTPLPAAGSVNMAWASSDNVAVSSVDLYYSKSSTPSTWVLIANGLGASGTYLWSYPSINEKRINVRARAFDAAGNVGSDVIVLLKNCTASPCDDEDVDSYREPFEP